MASSVAKNISYNKYNKNNNYFYEFRIDCYRLSDGVVHRENIRVSEKDFHSSLEYLQDLIEIELDIPRISQIEISINEVKLNCSMSPLIIGPLLRNLVTRNSERIIPISLQYYSACIRFSCLSQLVNRFNVALRNCNYRAIAHIIDCIDYDFICSNGWGSSRATGIRLYLADVGFMDKLVYFITHVHSILHSALEGYTDDRPGRVSYRMETTFCVPLSTLAMATKSMSATQDFLWNFGANIEDRLYQYNKEFLPLLFGTLKIVDLFEKSNDIELVKLGKSLSSNAFGVFGGFVEIWHIASWLNSDPTGIFLQFLKKQLLQPLSTCGYEFAVSSYIFLFLSSHCEISQRYIYENIYDNIINHFSDFHTQNSSLYLVDTTYCICLSLVNMLNTTGTWNAAQSSHRFNSILNIWEHFLKDTSPDVIARFERRNNFIWGSLEPFTALFFSPKNSYLGFKQRTTDSSSPEYRVVDLYLQMAHFSLEVVLRMASFREQLIRENLLTRLIVADWRLGRIVDKLRYFYPNLDYYPVPSLYDISALTAIREGLGYSASFFHNQ